MATAQVFVDGTGWRSFSAGDLPNSGVTAGSYGDSTHVGQFTVAANGTITAASNVAVSGGGGGGGGSEIGYDQITGYVTVNSTNAAAPNTVIAGSSYTFDGAPVLATFFTARVDPPLSAAMVFFFMEGASNLGRIGLLEAPGPLGFTCSYRFTPSAASHTYSIAAYCTASSGDVGAGVGGNSSTELPAYLRFTKV